MLEQGREREPPRVRPTPWRGGMLDGPGRDSHPLILQPVCLCAPFQADVIGVPPLWYMLREPQLGS